jgi:divalent metal cation (Fe/Co/Zn/Cd) transporter
MASILPIAAQDTIRRIQRIQTITIVWMSVEAAVSLSAAWIARSPALLAFGGDSTIELLSAVVVLWRFRAHAVQEHAERRASRIAGILLFVLAVYVVAASALTLLGYSEPKPTYLGIGILIAAASIMPWLAKEKRRLLRSYEQCCSESRFRSISPVCLPLADCTGRAWSQRDLARSVG